MGVDASAYIGVEIDPFEIMNQDEVDDMIDGNDDAYTYESFRIYLHRFHTTETTADGKRRIIENHAFMLLLSSCDEPGDACIKPRQMKKFLSVIKRLKRKKSDKIRMFITYS